MGETDKRGVTCLISVKGAVFNGYVSVAVVAVGNVVLFAEAYEGGTGTCSYYFGAAEI